MRWDGMRLGWNDCMLQGSENSIENMAKSWSFMHLFEISSQTGAAKKSTEFIQQTIIELDEKRKNKLSYLDGINGHNKDTEGGRRGTGTS